MKKEPDKQSYRCVKVHEDTQVGFDIVPLRVFMETLRQEDGEWEKQMILP